MMLLLAVLLTVLTGPPARATDPATVPDSGQWQGVSPDGNHLAALAIRPNEEMLWRPDIDTGLLEIADVAKGKITAAFDSGQLGVYRIFELGDRAGARAQWSPDSEFLVLTTVSNGGHSPWHSETFVYSVADGTLREMDDVTGPVVSPDFMFVGPHTVRVGIGIPSPDGYDVEHAKQVEVDLGEKLPAMKKRPVSKRGNISI